MKKTPWFPASVKPVHEGIYQTYWGYLGAVKLVDLFWQGDWHYVKGRIRCATFGMKGDKWRGIAKKP